MALNLHTITGNQARKAVWVLKCLKRRNIHQESNK